MSTMPCSPLVTSCPRWGVPYGTLAAVTCTRATLLEHLAQKMAPRLEDDQQRYCCSEAPTVGDSTGTAKRVCALLLARHVIRRWS